MRLIPRKAPQITLEHYQDFSAFVDAAFANKRKNINNNLKKLPINLEKLNINPLARAEELSLDEFMIMFKATLVA
jgi:16S rRNA A1518/A1519 N6-dimethyltransferase RsmA/KsgA/DIM1 with predicted DNA glycosylase/AP lyase activity